MDKYTVIVGANSGIGEEMVKKMHDKKLIIIDKEIKEEYVEQYICYKVDLRDVATVEEFVRNELNKYHSIENLIYCAGYQEEIGILDVTLDDWLKLYNVNVNSAFLISQIVALQMIKNKIKGCIVFISSIHAEIIRDIPHYSSSKAAQNMLMKELAYKLAEYGIRVFSIAPGSTDTPLLRKELHTESLMEEAAKLIPMKRHGNPKEIAELIAFIILSEVHYITGTVIIIDGGLSLVI